MSKRSFFITYIYLWFFFCMLTISIKVHDDSIALNNKMNKSCHTQLELYNVDNERRLIDQ